MRAERQIRRILTPRPFSELLPGVKEKWDKARQEKMDKNHGKRVGWEKLSSPLRRDPGATSDQNGREERREREVSPPMAGVGMRGSLRSFPKPFRDSMNFPKAFWRPHSSGNAVIPKVFMRPRSFFQEDKEVQLSKPSRVPQRSATKVWFHEVGKSSNSQMWEAKAAKVGEKFTKRPQSPQK